MKSTACALSASQLNNGRVSRWVGDLFWSRMMCAFIAALMLVCASAFAAGQCQCGLTDDQMQKLKAIAVDTRDDIETQRQLLRRARIDLGWVYHPYKLDDARARTHIGRISKAQKNLLDELLDNQVKLRQILNADQFAAFDKMLKSRMHGMNMTFTSPVLPIEEEALESALMPLLKNNRPPEQQKYVQVVKLVAKKKPQILQRLRKSSLKLAEMYSNYDLDAPAARRLINAIHRDQIGLTWMMHKRQQALRGLLTEDQFNQLQQDIDAKLKDPGFLKKHRAFRPK